MDNEKFRETYSAINEQSCPFEKGILTNNCSCAQAHRFCIAEREGVRCGSEEAREHCRELLEHLRIQARFALRSTDEDSKLPHAKAMKVQIGGLRGLHAALDPNEPLPAHIEDIYSTVEAALERFGSLDKLPYLTIVRQITAYKGRRPFRNRR